jgi:hypothetical protein
MSDPAAAADCPVPMAADPVAPPAPKRELSPARADDASDAPAAKKAKSEAPPGGAADASEAALEPKPEPKPRAAPKAMTEEEKLAAVAAKIKEQTERTAKAAAIAAQKEADKMEAKIAAQLTKGQEDKLKKAMKVLASELTNVTKCVAAKEAAEVKAMGAGISPADLAAFVAARSGKSGKTKPGGAAAAAASAPIKSTADILKEPECPDDRLPARLIAYEGDAGDRHKLMAWKKEVEKFKDRVDRERDAYVAKRKKALKAEAAKGAQALHKALAEVTKRLDLLDKANACVVRAQKELELVKERGEQLQETLALKAKLAREKLDAKNAVALAALDQKLARMEGRKLDEAKATVEREAAKEREKREAKEAREAQRKAEKAERDRAKDEEKKSRAAAREAERAALAKKKEDAIKHKQRLAKYPIPDVELAAEFEEEARLKNVSVESLGYKPLPTPAPVADSPFLADEAALADFLGVFGDALKTPKGVGTAAGVRAVLRAPEKDDLRALYRALLKACMEQAVIGKGRNVLQWRRVLSDATWPEIARRVLERKKVGGAGAEALARAPWQSLSPAEHVLALRGLADLALGADKPRAIIAKRLEEAQALRYARILEYNAEAQRRRAVENKAKEKRKAIRAEAAAKRKAEKEEKRKAREAAMAAGEEVEDDDDDDDDDNDDDDDDDDDAGDAAGAGDDDDEGPTVDDEEKEEEKEETPEPEKKPARAPRKPREPSPEPSFELPKHLREYEGHPEDRKALMAWRAELNKVSNQLAIDKREYEKRKRAELRKQQEKERMERLRREEAEEAKRLKAKAEEERKEKEARKKEAKRMDEDAAVSVRTKSLGKDRRHRTYWWGVGGMKGVLYVEEVDGAWGVLSTRKEVDQLMDALHAWGNNERALKQALQRRVHTIHAEFRKRARAGEENGDDEESPSNVAPSSDRPSGVADESVPLAAARAQLSAVCALAESAAQKRADGTLGNPDGSLWRDFSARVASTECAAAAALASTLGDVEEALRAAQVREFMDPAEAEARAAAAEAGEEYESDEEEEFLDDDDFDDEQIFGDARDQETYESKAASGMIYPIFDTKVERAKWREGVRGDAPAAALAFSVAALQDAAAPFLRALIKHPR